MITKGIKRSRVLLRIGLGITVLSTVGLIIIFAVSNTIIHDAVYENVMSQARRDKMLYAAEIDSWFTTATQTVHTLSTTLPTLNTTDNFEDIAQAFVAEYDFIENIFIGFSNEVLMNGVNWPQPEGWLVTVRPWYIAARSTDPGTIAFTEPYVSNASGNIAVAISTYVPGLGGVGATVGAAMPINTILDRMRAHYVLGEGYLTLISPTGEILAHPNPDFAPIICLQTDDLTLQHISVLPGYSQLIESFHMYEDRSSAPVYFNGEYFIATQLSTMGWYLVAVAPTSVITTPVATYLTMVIVPIGILLVVLFSLTMTYVTFLVKDLEKRQLSEERMRKIFDSIPLATSLRDRNNKFLYANKEAVRMFGLSDISEYESRFNELSPPHQPDGACSREKVAKLLEQAYQQGHLQIDWMHQTLDTGEALPSEITIELVNINGEEYLATFVRDMRKLHASLEKEREASDRIQFMFDNTPLYIQYWTQDYRVVDCNQNIMKVYGYHAKEEYIAYMASRKQETRPEYMAAVKQWTDHLDKAFAEGRTDFDFIDMTAEGKPFHTRIVALRVRFNGETVVITYGTDITDLKQVQLSLEDAEENSRKKDRFIARISHEIRTPISAILGISEIELQQLDLHYRIEESFSKINDSAYTLLGIVNDILDLSKIEAGKLDVVPANYDVTTLVSDVNQLHMLYQGNKTIGIQLYVDKSLPTELIGDQLRIKQVLNNLLSNALKYTMEGTVTILMEYDYNMLTLTIKDTGLGMTDEQLKLIYNEYVRLHEDTSTASGTGLGMSIVYNLIKLMDGRIDIQSKLGQGTTVSVQLPQPKGSDKLISMETIHKLERLELDHDKNDKKFSFTPKPMPHATVLIVDDIEANLYVARGLMSFYQLNIETANSGQEAIDKINSGKTYDLIFMDQTMPDLDGTQTVQILRENGYNKPIVVLTANAIIGHSERFLKSGFDGFISKPINTNHLNSILVKFIPDDPNADAAPPVESGGNINSFMSDPLVLKRLQKDFYKTQHNMIQKLQTAIEASDIRTAHRLAHSLKGLAGLIGEDTVANYAKKAEQELQETRKLDPETQINLTVELEKALSKIDIDEEKTTPTGSIDMLSGPDFTELVPLLKQRSQEATTFIPALKKLPDTETLIALIEGYDFRKAIKEIDRLLNN